MSKLWDTVIGNVSVIDGSGTNAFYADVAIKDGTIAAIQAATSLHAADAKSYIDAHGLTLSPGFIDVHTHDDREVLINPTMQAKLTQGVTTVITGNCGISLAPWVAQNDVPAPLSLIGTKKDYKYAKFADYFSAVEAAQPAVNVASLVGHSCLRVSSMQDWTKPATQGEIQTMQAAVEEAMQAGAVGLSSGLFYQTAQQAPNEEVIALAKVVAQHGGVYTSHIRDEYDKVVDSLQEACDAGQHAQLPVIISHHKCAGPSNWGRTVETLNYLNERRKKQSVVQDAYPYTAGSTVLDPAYVDGVIRIMVTFSEPFPEMTGRYLEDIAREWGISQKEAAKKLSPAGGVYFQMDEADVRRVLSDPHTMIGSDGLPHDAHPHPRLWGAFPRVLGHYAREQKLFTLAEGVRRMTSLSADQFGLKRRGRIALGMAADLVLFDATTIIDVATFEVPKQAARGIHSVWVNGVLALSDGKLQAERGGRVLKPKEERFR